MLNHIDIQGRLVGDPELRMTQNNTAVTSFTLAVNRDYNKDETDFISCVAWKNTAEFVNKYFRKGQLMLVSGKLQSRKWIDRNGQNRISWDVHCDNVYFGESKRDAGEGYSAGEPQYIPPKAPDVIPDEEEGELPF